ncbi:MAG: (2Fe-2S)-binding protein [Sumerlaeia bacterium]
MFKPDDDLCVCFHVSQGKIKKFIRLENPDHVSQVSECYSAGTGCGWCIPYIEKLFEAHKNGSACEMTDMTASEYRERRKLYLKTQKP